MTLLRVLETVHGHLAILAAIALLHPAIALRAGRPLSRGGRWSVALTTVVTVLAFGTGLFMYGDYREIVRRPLFEEHPGVGMLFETKEHLAWAVLSMALGAGAAAWLAPRRSRSLRRVAAVVYAVAATLALATVAIGTYVAAVGSFPQ